MINGLRVKQAREINKFTQSDLAKRLNITQSTVGKLENGIKEGGDSLIEQLALQTGFPTSFFLQGLAPDFPLGTLLFRCLAKLSAAEKARIRQIALLQFEIIEKMSIGTKPIPLHLPNFDYAEPKEAAKITRTSLGISPDSPIPHLLHKLEKNGVFVLAVSDASEHFDAFSLWSDGNPRRPIIVMNVRKPTDRARFSCAHELAHLVLHRSPRGAIKDLEKEAHIFASEFLLPEEVMLREIRTPLSFKNLGDLKKRWGVSIQALIVRAFDLEMITKRQYTYMFEQLSRLGYRKREPAELDIKPEKPRLFSKLAEMSFGSPPNISKMASLVSITPTMAEKFLSTYAVRNDLPKANTEIVESKDVGNESQNSYFRKESNVLIFNKKIA